jgi:hypothetical protein
MTDADMLQQALASNDPNLLKLVHRLVTHPLYKFRPRPDKPEELVASTKCWQLFSEKLVQ